MNTTPAANSTTPPVQPPSPASSTPPAPTTTTPPAATTPPLLSTSEPPKPADPPKPGDPPAPLAADPGKPVPLTGKDVTLPEGVTVNWEDPLAKEYLGILNDDKLDAKSRAAALTGIFPKVQERINADNLKTWTEMQDQWQGDLKKQHGAQFPEKLSKVAASIEAYSKHLQGLQAPGSPPIDHATVLREAATMTGWGNNPATMNYIFWLTDQISEGSPLGGSPAGGAKDRATTMFGK